jgi:hypothetical protein
MLLTPIVCAAPAPNSGSSKQQDESVKATKPGGAAQPRDAPDAASALTMLQQLAEDYYGKARKFVEDHTEASVLFAGVTVLGLACAGLFLHIARSNRR